MIAPRRPWLAALLTLIAPGLGHLYAGMPRAALAVGLVIPAAVVFGFGMAWTFLSPGWSTVVLGLLVALGLPLACVLHAATCARRAGSMYELRPYNRWYYYLVAWVAVTLCARAAYALVMGRIGEPFRIGSPASEPELLAGDHVWAAKLPRSVLVPERDALVIFVSVEETTPGLQIVKRVIGTPGDTLAMVGDTVVRNGQRLLEPYAIGRSPGGVGDPERLRQIRDWQLDHYIGPDSGAYQPTVHDWRPLVVPPGHFFALGDNRDQSYDSRFYGFVPAANVRSRPRLVYLSWDPDARGMRWNRVGHAVR